MGIGKIGLEFGRYGAESLGKLVSGGKTIETIVRESMEIPKGLSKELYAKAKGMQNAFRTDVVTTTDKYGRKVITDKSGYKVIFDKDGELIYERTPKDIKIGEFVRSGEEGYPILKYRITRPKSANDRVFMDTKLTQNGFSGDSLVSYSQEPGKNSYHYRSENLFNEKLSKVVDKFSEVLKEIL